MAGVFEEFCSVVDRPVEKLESGSFWRRDDPIIVDTTKGPKVTRGGMFEHQREWWNLKTFVLGLIGGLGCGKTILLCKRAISSALQNAPVPVAVVSPTFPLARRTVIPTIRSLLSGKQSIYGPHQFWWRYNKTLHEFYGRFRGRDWAINIYSGEDPDTLRGANLGSAYLDEPFLMEIDVFNHILARVRHPDAPHKEIGLSGSPEGLGWGYDLFVGDLRERHDVSYIRASSRQNLAVGSEYVKRLEGAFTDKAAEAYIEGKFVDLSAGRVYYAFDPTINMPDLPVPDEAELGAGMDFNVNPMCATVFWRAGSHLHFFDEIESANADTEFVCSLLRERYVEKTEETKHIKPTLYNIYPDATGSARKTAAPGGKSDFYFIRKFGFNICARDENPKRRDRYNAVNGKFKPRQGVPTLTISPKCRKLIKYLSQYSYENMNRQEMMSHLTDSFSYPVAYLFPVARDLLSVTKLSGW